MSQQYIFSMSKVGKIVHPKREILKDISLSFYYGAKIGVLGLNGAGKSTLLKIIAGEDKNHTGEIGMQKDIKVGYLAQEPRLDGEKTVKENIEQGVSEIKEILNRFNEISNKFLETMSDDEMNKLLAEQGVLQDKIDAVNGWDIDRTLEMAAQSLHVPPFDSKVENLSGGEKRRVALCKLIVSNPDLLLLDEPTNHLDADSVSWLEKYLQEFKGTVIAITHDRYFLDNVAEWILELDRGQGIPFQGNYSSWLEQKNKRLEMEEKQESSMNRTIKAELEWVRKSPKGRNAKNKARIARFEELNSKEFQKRNETKEIYIPPGPRLGDVVLEVKDLHKKFKDRELFNGLSFNMPKGAIVGIIGPNGMGKSTLFKIITENEKSDSGNIRVGETVKLAYVDQSRDSLDDDKSVWEDVSGGADFLQVGTYEIPSRAYVSRFNFKGSDQQKLVKNLSGGERNRLHLANVLKKGGNLLLLDEPTNDLDVETLRALEEAILDFPGNILLISHDRWFLDRVATHILSFEEDGIHWFEGNYTDYVQDCIARYGEDYATKRGHVKKKGSIRAEAG